MAKGTKYSQQFKEDAVQYRIDHSKLSLRKAAENLGVSESALKNWNQNPVGKAIYGIAPYSIPITERQPDIFYQPLNN